MVINTWGLALDYSQLAITLYWKPSLAIYLRLFGKHYFWGSLK